jgi:hypothetical protein
VSWGIPVFIVMGIINYQHRAISFRTWIEFAVIYLLGGLLYGQLVWLMSERRYKRLLAAQTEQQQSDTLQTIGWSGHER